MYTDVYMSCVEASLFPIAFFTNKLHSICVYVIVVRINSRMNLQHLLAIGVTKLPNRTCDDELAMHAK